MFVIDDVCVMEKQSDFQISKTRAVRLTVARGGKSLNYNLGRLDLKSNEECHNITLVAESLVGHP